MRADDSSLLPALAERTLRLCSVKSPIGSEAALCDQLQREGERAFPGEVERIGNSLVLGKISGRKPSLALFGHIDTVPLQEGDFPARREGGRIFGRGASDMKGSVALLLELFDRLGPGEREQLPVEPVVIFYDREEGPYLESGLGPVLEQRTDLQKATLALCLEPTDLALQVGCCGALHATFTFHGRSAHSARPWQGENAIHKAGALLSHLHAQKPVDVAFDTQIEGVPPLVFREVLSCTRIDGFTGRNVVPAKCELNLNYRFAPGKSIETAEAELEALAKTFGAECKVIDRSPAGAVAVDNPILRNLQRITHCAIEPKQAWTDVARLSSLGIAAANFGPGDQAQAHQRGESCSEEALLQGYLALRMLLELRA